jgi:hypothetical protein
MEPASGRPSAGPPWFCARVRISYRAARVMASFSHGSFRPASSSCEVVIAMADCAKRHAAHLDEPTTGLDANHRGGGAGPRRWPCGAMFGAAI